MTFDHRHAPPTDVGGDGHNFAMSPTPTAAVAVMDAITKVVQPDYVRCASNGHPESYTYVECTRCGQETITGHSCLCGQKAEWYESRSRCERCRAFIRKSRTY